MNPTTPFISVIVPVYNRKQYMEQLLSSFEILTYPRDCFEVIVVDNFSSDGTWEMLEKAHGNAAYTLRVFRNPSKIRTASSSRNFGVRQSRGQILAFTDSDCVVTPNWLQSGVRSFRPGVGMVQGRTIPHNGEAVPVFHHTVSVKVTNSYGETCNIFYIRDYVMQVGGFDEQLGRIGSAAVWGEDTDLVYRIKALGKTFVPAQDALVYHHIVPTRFRSWLLEPVRAWLWPKVVKRHPGIRRDLLFGRYFFTRMTALFDLLLAGLLLGILWHWEFLFLGVPFLIAKYREGGAHLHSMMRLARVAGGSLRAFVMFCTLLGSSVRFRSVVL